MIRMTRELNAANFGDRPGPVVTCNTCHQGSLQPNGVPNFWGKANKTPEQIAAYIKERQPGPASGQGTTPLPAATSSAPAAVQPLPSVESVYENYRKAVGTTPLTSMHMVAEGEPDLSPPVRLEIYVIFPDKIEIEQTPTGPGTRVRQIINGDRGWTVTPTATISLTPEQIKNVKASPLFSPVKFSVADVPRTVSGVEKIGDHSYYVVEWRTAKNRNRLYFDTQSGLLYKSHGDAFTPLGTYPYETMFANYRDVNGIKFPGSMDTQGTSGGARLKYSEIQINVPIESGKFEPPPPQPSTAPK
jgi:mono/diheme cytochrome c family protein